MPKIVKQDNYCNIDKIISYQNGCEQLFWALQQFSYNLKGFGFLCQTSAPEISAEQASSTNKSTKPNTTERSIAKIKKIKLEGSGSKSDTIN